MIYLNLGIIPKLLENILKENDLTLYEYNFVKEDGNLILRIIIDNEDKGVDINLLGQINEYLSTELDKYDSDMDNYFLEVSSLGAERELKDFNALVKNVGKYIHVELKNQEIYEGYLTEAQDNIISVKINLKGRIKNLQIKYEDIKFVRLAVKI